MRKNQISFYNFYNPTSHTVQIKIISYPSNLELQCVYKVRTVLKCTLQYIFHTSAVFCASISIFIIWSDCCKFMFNCM